MAKIKLQRRHGQWHYRGVMIRREGRASFVAYLNHRAFMDLETLQAMREMFYKMEEDGWAEALQCIDD